MTFDPLAIAVDTNRLERAASAAWIASDPIQAAEDRTARLTQVQETLRAAAQVFLDHARAVPTTHAPIT